MAIPSRCELPFEQIVRVHASSGTTGKKKVLCYTQRDLDDWAHFFARGLEMAGLTPMDRVQLCVGYGLWTAGIGFQLACERFGVLTIPTGPGNLDMQCQCLEDFQTTVVCCTASMALLLAEEVHRRGLQASTPHQGSLWCGAFRCRYAAAHSDTTRRGAPV